MKKQLFYFLALFTFCSFSKISQAQQFWIVGGQSATEGQFPWFADFREDGGHACGATLIAPQWVLTAAHCNGFPGFPTGTRTIRLNSINTVANTVNPNGGVEVGVAQAFPHPQFSMFNLLNGYDIMLLKLDSAVTSIQPIDIIRTADTASAYLTNAPVHVAGWGYQDATTTSNPDTLKWVTSKVYDWGQCQALPGNSSLSHKMFCLGYSANETPTGAAQGDSGGPAWIEKDGELKQIGIVSGGMGTYTGADSPGFFTKVAFFSDWIDSVINANTTAPTSVQNAHIPAFVIGLSEYNNRLRLHIGDFQAKTLFVKIIGIDGSVIRKEEFINPAFRKEEMDMEGLATGMYVVHMSDENGRYLSKKIFKY